MVEKIINRILLLINSFNLIIAAYYIFYANNYVMFTTCILSFVTYIFSVKYIKIIQESILMRIMIIISLYANTIGMMWLYDAYTYYDKILHFLTPIMLTYLIKKHLSRKNNSEDNMITFLSVGGLLSLWEVMEWVVTKYLNYNMEGCWHNNVMVLSYLDDTMLDLCVGLIGSYIYLIVSKWMEKK